VLCGKLLRVLERVGVLPEQVFRVNGVLFGG
jgi:hypothetical protein